jgi:hypothetical protein
MAANFGADFDQLLPRVVTDKCSGSSGMLDFSFGSKLPLRGAIDLRPELGAQPKQIARKLTFALGRPKLEVFSPWLMPCQNGEL